MSPSPTDQQLVARAREGDQCAFELLVRKYQHKVLKLIMRYVRDMDEAMDLTQETFVKAWKALGSFRGDSAFYTWIYRIAVNTAKNHLVSVQRQPYTVDLDADETDQYAAEPELTDTNTPEGEALGSELHRVVMQAIHDLPEDLRTAITLRELEGLSYEEIAEVMGCPIGTVRSRIFRAREAIDKRLQPLLG